MICLEIQDIRDVVNRLKKKKKTLYCVTRSEELKAVIYVTSSANKASET